MKIRSITYFMNPDWPVREEAFASAYSFIESARPAYETNGFEVQAARLALASFARMLPSLDKNTAVDFALRMEKRARAAGYDYISLGPATPDRMESYGIVPDMLAATENLFLSGILNLSEDVIALNAVRACAMVIQRCARIKPDGFANLRFAALANVSPGAPFFPAGYHEGENSGFALAIEAADLAVATFTGATSLEAARTSLISEIERQAARLERLGEDLEAQHGARFLGIDFTLAPFPESSRSIGTAIELLGAPAVGQHGTLAACAFMTSALEQAAYRRIGFNGIMLPVLEDIVLAKRVSQGLLSLNELLLYSAVCGTGLDTIPLPGDISTEELTAVLLDLTALALRLNKPLTARLMPIPGKKTGDATNFDFDYFANSKIIPVKAQALRGLFSTAETIQLARRGDGRKGTEGFLDKL